MSGQRAPKPFLCALGRHRPDPFARWNAGYYFARCRRCGADLVRASDGPWMEPRGFRVVWSAEPPPGTEKPSLSREPVAEAPKPPPSPRRVSYVPDFMDDPATDTSWRRHLPPAPDAPASDDSRQPGQSGQLGDIARLVPPLRSGKSGDGAEPSPQPRRRAAIAALSLLMLAILAFALFGRDTLADASPRGKSMPSPALPAEALVAETMLSCRAAPRAESAHVRLLVRGDTVRLREGGHGWALVAQGGQECWVPLGALAESLPSDD